MNWPGGESLPGIPAMSGSGPWLRCVAGTGNSFPGLAFCGEGYLDDVVVTDGFPLPVTNLITRLTESPLAVSWPAEYGRNYQIQSCTNLRTHDWQPFGQAATGNGLTNILSLAATNGPSRFFRIQAPGS